MAGLTPKTSGFLGKIIIKAKMVGEKKKVILCTEWTTLVSCVRCQIMPSWIRVDNVTSSTNFTNSRLFSNCKELTSNLPKIKKLKRLKLKWSEHTVLLLLFKPQIKS